jgi:dinuclear metal center YbgI/SA1388 family protein
VLNAILALCDDLLEVDRFSDYGPNGLQVPGVEDVTTVATGVSAGRELFERARSARAELVLVHHGLFWDGAPRALSPTMAGRLRVLLAASMSLAQYHLPLDAHPEIGNNALLADGLGLIDRAPFVHVKGAAIGVRGTLPGDGLSPDALVARVREITDRDPLAYLAGADLVRTVGICSGGAARDVVTEGAGVVDAVLTGEPTESVMNEAREAGLHFLAAGHYATETFGIRALGERVAQEFGVEHIWIDVPNPV